MPRPGINALCASAALRQDGVNPAPDRPLHDVQKQEDRTSHLLDGEKKIGYDHGGNDDSHATIVTQRRNEGRKRRRRSSDLVTWQRMAALSAGIEMDFFI